MLEQSFTTSTHMPFLPATSAFRLDATVLLNGVTYTVSTLYYKLLNNDIKYNSVQQNTAAMQLTEAAF